MLHTHPTLSKPSANGSGPAPGQDTVGGDPDQGAGVSWQAQGAVLRLLVDQKVDRPGELTAVGEDIGAAIDDDVTEPGPLLVVLVDDQRDPRILLDVTQAPELPRPLGLGVDGGVEAGAIEDVAHGD